MTRTLFHTKVTKGARRPIPFLVPIAAFVCCFPLIVFAQSPSASASQSASPDETRKSSSAGKKLYERVGCYECHGHVGQGGAAGKRLAPHPIQYSDFAAYCRHPKAEMPPYSVKILSDADLASIYAYLQSVPDPPPVKRIPALNAAGRKAAQ